jgi:hypothetical protein
MTSPLGEVQITGVDAEVQHAAIVARFKLGGRPVDPEWQGAFGRAIKGRLDGIAAANAYVAEVLDAARADRAEFSRLDSKLRIELETAQAAMRAQLGIEQDAATDRAAVARFDDESPAVEVLHEPEGLGAER